MLNTCNYWADAEGAGEMFQVTSLPLDNLPRTKKELLITKKISSENTPT
jgi:hypothetical protein